MTNSTIKIAEFQKNSPRRKPALEWFPTGYCVKFTGLTLSLSRFRPDDMKLIFSILSIAYVTGIFILAGSPIVHRLAFLNPYSLLHIPLYGILTFLLIFSLMPLRFNPGGSIHLSHQGNPTNWRIYFPLSGGIGLLVAIADEIYQSHIPGREASVTDILLDLVGISLALFLCFRFLKTKTSHSCSK